MTPREEAIYRLLNENPYISQQEIANQLELPRSSVATAITSLSKQGYIKGRAYILDDSPTILCIGAGNVDRKFYLKEPILAETSNPVSQSLSVGGVGRNVAENLGRLGYKVSFLTGHGTDGDWQTIAKYSQAFMDLNLSFAFDTQHTGNYTAVVDQTGDLVYGFANMDIYDQVSVDHFGPIQPVFKEVSSIVMDLNLPKDVNQYIVSQAKSYHKELVVVTVSRAKMKRMPDQLDGITWLVCNKDELEAYFGQSYHGQDAQDAIQTAGMELVKLGVSNVIVTQGVDPVIYCHEEGSETYQVQPSNHVAEVTGAGDAFVGGLVYGIRNRFEKDKIIKYAMANSRKTLESIDTVRKDLTSEQLFKDVEEY